MKKINEFKSMYKNNRPLFNMIIYVVMVVLIIWQSIFTLIIPTRSNIILLFILIGSFIYFYLKNESTQF